MTDLADRRRWRGWHGLVGWLLALVSSVAGAVIHDEPLAPPALPDLPVQVLTQARHRVQSDLAGLGPAPSEPGAVLDLPEPTRAEAWAPVALPRFEPRDPSRADDPARRAQVDWILLEPERPEVAADQAGAPLALYLPRVVGAAVLVGVHDGQVWRLRWDGRDGRREQWNRPVLVELGAVPPPGRPLRLVVGLLRLDGAETRLAAPQVGGRGTLARRVAWRHALQQVAPQVGSLAFLCVGLFAWLFWLGRRPERAYLLFALCSLVWWLRNLHYYAALPADQGLFDWVWWVTNASMSWVMVLAYLFALGFAPRRAPWLERALAAFVLLMSVLAMPIEASPLRSQAQLHLMNAVVGAVVLGHLSAMAWRGGRREFRVITAGLCLTECLGVHDLMLMSGRLSPDGVYLLPYASLVMLLTFLYAVQVRYSGAIREVERVNAGLGERLAAREAELQANHERLRRVEREQALLLERQRLMRDMHDGLGSTLMSSLVLAEQGRLDGPAVAGLLRECVDDLRLVIDSLEPIGHDLVTLLASLRHRLGRRLEAAGLRIVWDVQDLPPLEWLQPPDALQVLRIVQEVMTNVLRHAGASQVRLSTALEGDRVSVRVEDDGCGFDPDAVVPGRGLRHLGQRAARLGGTLQVDSRAGAGTRVRLDLPLQRGLAS